MAIKDVKVWSKTVGSAKDTRVYVHTTDNREGCWYVTGNRYEKKNTKAGDLTADDWKEAEQMAVWDGSWHTVYAQGDQQWQRQASRSRAGHGQPNHCMDKSWGKCGVCFDCMEE